MQTLDVWIFSRLINIKPIRGSICLGSIYEPNTCLKIILGWEYVKQYDCMHIIPISYEYWIPYNSANKLLLITDEKVQSKNYLQWNVDQTNAYDYN